MVVKVASLQRRAARALCSRRSPDEPPHNGPNRYRRKSARRYRADASCRTPACPCCNSAIRVPQIGNAGDEGFGAVDRIEHPDIFGILALVAEFLADDAVLGEVGLDQARASPPPAARSASVTGSKSSRSCCRRTSEVRKNGRMVSPDAVARRSDEGCEIDDRHGCPYTAIENAASPSSIRAARAPPTARYPVRLEQIGCQIAFDWRSFKRGFWLVLASRSCEILAYHALQAWPSLCFDITVY